MTARTPGDVFDDIFGSSTARTPGDVLNDLFGPAATARDDVVVMTGQAVTAVTRVGDVEVSAMTVAMMKASDAAMLRGMLRHRSRSPSSSPLDLESSSGSDFEDTIERWEGLAGRKLDRSSVPPTREQAVDSARQRRRRRRLAPIGGSTTLEQPVDSARKRRRRSQHAPRDSEATSGDARMTDACACEATGALP